MLNTDKWIKYSYVCPDCDSLIEYTCKLPDDFPSGSVTEITCICGGKAGQVSVEGGTIGQLTEQKEGTMEDTVSKDAIIAMWRQELELTYGNQITELQNKLDATNQYVESYKNKVNNLQTQVNHIIDNRIQKGMSRTTNHMPLLVFTHVISCFRFFNRIIPIAKNVFIIRQNYIA